ncbi:tRNA (cytosine(32)/uridine(32)-2'-O)-methyltransferase TrmJ [Ferrimonas balearica]|uniref:tRNA (cytosine(32)/uridine(32)-2'-O)-methyltransferase TrmJ n=1 Tax=Ferrimonas balearica TaxID=44012 RepID=UPI001C56AF45|nr:tRNA (cytosine(32)/uridine(32)-2'-O)-methyltransferase TrmJ [Ferrimonas balearica]MBW3140041.1 tRNA (cytosine(32)/uridine(32)-2'-O)-methyltransferase TrmJ [Ferrimonas balearica]MBW3165065.1 tRNA (cytosine(32)/uridine(32)-2'-O)-methyltransferase TrmJ [Ferrimonas balearica]MBY6106851.1 tRNA (cytosine(32)/uridine(32)-2'-O)-methyltransferase TrmJ [Ferrimonas balearica]
MLSNVRIVLVGTTHPGNIGSAARAMKTMGLSQLFLAEPKVAPDGQSIALAAGASDLLKNLVVTDDLASAIADCSLVIGTSARSRTLSWPMLDAREAGVKLASEANTGPVALVFGRENSGLSNEELQMCHYHVCIPANPEYSSLNLAQAVQLLSYETRMAHLAQTEQPSPETEVEYPTQGQMEGLYQHLEQTLSHTGFIIKAHPGQVMNKLRRLFNRARPEQTELAILRGVLTSVDKATGRKKGS